MLRDKNVSIPQDANKRSVQIQPSMPVLKATYNEALSTTSVRVTLDEKTGFIEVSAGADAGIFIKFDGTAIAATDGFDRFCGAGQTRHWEVPYEATTVDFIALEETQLTLIEQ